jgi:hypothetical protein
VGGRTHSGSTKSPGAILDSRRLALSACAKGESQDATSNPTPA